MTFDELRAQHPVFTYEGYDYSIEGEGLRIRFHYRIGDTIHFDPTMMLLAGRNAQYPADLTTLEGIIFHIGMIELISYWKCTCSPVIRILPHRLNADQQEWWRKLFWLGLGEFRYTNNLHATPIDFFDFEFPENAVDIPASAYPHVEPDNRIIVPIGGGKDSVVTLEELRTSREVVPFIINPRGATIECARVAGFASEDDMLILHREIDPMLLKLNKEGYLNGHTPFSAMLAFYTTLLSAVTGIRDVALSNESSANEPTIPGTQINHQYSKSLEFELDFRNYVTDHLNDLNHYYSHLRKLTELQIAERFAHHPQYFPVFKSCNVGSKEDKWCCHCPKCLFAYVILSPFLDDDTLTGIFGEDLLDKAELAPLLDELDGMSKTKPFECVGTIREVNEALRRICNSRPDKALVKHYINKSLEQLEDNMLEEYFNMAP